MDHARITSKHPSLPHPSFSLFFWLSPPSYTLILPRFLLCSSYLSLKPKPSIRGTSPSKHALRTPYMLHHLPPHNTQILESGVADLDLMWRHHVESRKVSCLLKMILMRAPARVNGSQPCHISAVLLHLHPQQNWLWERGVLFCLLHTPVATRGTSKHGCHLCPWGFQVLSYRGLPDGGGHSTTRPYVLYKKVIASFPLSLLSSVIRPIRSNPCSTHWQQILVKQP